MYQKRARDGHAAGDDDVRFRRCPRADVDAFTAAIEPLASRRQARRAAGAVPAELPAWTKTRSGISPGCCRRSRTIRWRSSFGTAAGATASGRSLDLLQRARRGVGADRRAEVPLLDPPGPPAEPAQPLLHAAARPERGEVVDARPSRRALQLPLLAGRNRRLRRHGHPRASARPEDLRLHEQPLRREGGGERGDAAARRWDSRSRASTRTRCWSGTRSSGASWLGQDRTRSSTAWRW